MYVYNLPLVLIMVSGSMNQITLILVTVTVLLLLMLHSFLFRLTLEERLLRNGQSKLKVYSTVIMTARQVEKQQRWLCHSLKERKRTTLQVSATSSVVTTHCATMQSNYSCCTSVCDNMD